MRPALQSDADAIAELEIELFPENCFSENTLANEIGVGLGWVEFDPMDKEIIGYLLARIDGELMDITRVGVKRSYRKSGVGTKLVRAALRRAGNVMLCVGKDNTDAMRLYFREGFHIVGDLDTAWAMRRR